ncbi:MAG: hypothetical protein K8L97_17100 [Anaerolineae bacterium]|nr:hypothetical protein [Anaerolineae bacterium]
MTDILLLLLHILSIVWLLRIIAAGVGQMERNAGVRLSWFNIALTVMALALLVVLDRYYATNQSEIATWRLIPVFVSGCVLVGTRVFWTTSEYQTVSVSLKYLPKLIGIFAIFLCTVLVFA